jgi:hypothetical protein
VFGGRKRLPAEKSPPLARGATKGNKDIIRTEGDEKLESTNKEAGSTERTKDAKQQSRMSAAAKS